MDIKSAMALIALNPKIRCKRSLPVPWEARKGRPIMRLTEIVFALTLTVATPTFAQSPQTGAGTPASHSTTASPTQGSTTATRASTSVRQFKTETEAKSACGSQPVVWGNTSSHVLHAAGSEYYGKTKRGAYMCQSAAELAGYHMASNGQ